MSEKVVKERLERGTVSMKERQSVIRELFQGATCEIEEQKVDKHYGNVICTLPGETDSTIVVGGHYDFIERGQGIVDDWTGTALLPSLYQSMKGETRKHTYVFIAFAAEERGLVGSTAYVKKLSAAQRAKIQAVVNLECLGMGPVNVWVSRSTPSLVLRLAEVAKAIEVPLHRVDVDKVGDDDTHPFHNLGIPVLSIHSITQESYSILHTAKDQLSVVKMSDYYTAYRLAAFYLSYLDLKLP
ncbi:M28 family metallopeptidase [Bryobacter aggregatus]|uniref:M28 family metallopeptidase n=1 Tax=Bryobacter aggregatus TaxID=360054 RepID=UPI00138DE049|nr:DUF4910 domain-containing protein [Bryobacter aggregatus]